MAAQYKKSVTIDLDDNLHEDLKNFGVLVLDTDIGEETEDAEKVGFTKKFYRDLMHLAMVKRPKSDIWVIINSGGGDVYQGLTIYDTIKWVADSGITINTCGLGIVASMALVIMQAGTRRFSFPSTQFMVHQAKDFQIFSLEEASEKEESAAELKRLNSIILSKISERAGIELPELLKVTKKFNYWLDAQSAKGFGTKGLIDEVITTIPFTR